MKRIIKKLKITLCALLCLAIISVLLLGVRLLGFEGGRAVLDNGKLRAVADVGYRFVGWESGERDEEISIYSGKGIFSVPIFEPDIIYFPVISITTEGNKTVSSKETYVGCTVTLTGVAEEYALSGETARIKLRGNSTAGLEKKPYKLKFDEKVDLFGEGKAKEWTLLANHMDYSLVRNYIVFSVAGELDYLHYTTSVHFVDVYVNGSYEGVYTLCEQVEAGKNRVNIADGLDDLDTGYLIEMDARAPSEGALGRDYFVASAGQPYAIKSPDTEDEDFTAAHAEYIKNYVNDALAALDSGMWTDVTEYIDVYSFADGYLLDELFKPCDIGFSSFYMYKDVGGKLTRGPVWDYDLSSGNSYPDKVNDTSGIYSGIVNPWYAKLLNYAEFREILTARIEAEREAIEARIEQCFEHVSRADAALERNFERWDILGKFTMEWNSDEACSIDSFDGQISFLKTWVEESLDSLSARYAPSHN